MEIYTALEIPKEVTEFVDLIAIVRLRVNQLLTTKPEFLMQLLYRLDVDEEKAKAALQEGDPAEALAILIVEREKLRQEIRRKFST